MSYKFIFFLMLLFVSLISCDRGDEDISTNFDASDSQKIDIIDSVETDGNLFIDDSQELKDDLIEAFITDEKNNDYSEANIILETVEEIVTCNEAEKCDDNNTCTKNDKCVDGICKGEKFSCNDGRECTDDICDGKGGCLLKISEGKCLIYNVCYSSEETAFLNACLICDPEISQSDWTVADNQSKCGNNDPCLKQGLCLDEQCDALPETCDDNNACTDDFCEFLTGCTHKNNLNLCEDGDACTLGDQCENGACKPGPIPLDCDDNNQCTLDSCYEEGCHHVDIEGSCEDGKLCTINDQCLNGVCVSGNLLGCEDGNDCTDDFCEQGKGCIHEVLDNPCCIGGFHMCDDANPCTTDDCDINTGKCFHENNTNSCDDNNPCTANEVCSEGVCSGEAADCNDGNMCTTDFCQEGYGCMHEKKTGECDDGNACTTGDKCVSSLCKGTLINCNDNDPCTEDKCDPSSGCYHIVLIGPCNDNNACTINTVCVNGICKGDALNCGDNNACTADACHPVFGCQHQNISGTCDDGDPCTDPDICIGGVCKGQGSGCVCNPTFSQDVNKITLFAIGENGKPEQGLDIDENPSTCSPEGNCASGIDNNLSFIAFMVNTQLDEQIKNGKFFALFEHENLKINGQAFKTNFYTGTIKDPSCNFNASVCEYLVDKSNFDEDCKSIVSINNSKITSGKLKAGGKNYTFTIPLLLFGDTVNLNLYFAHLEAAVTINNGKITFMNGLLGGAVKKQELYDTVSLIPDDKFPENFKKDTVLSMINILPADIDTDNNGQPESMSIGIKFKAIQGKIVGVY